MTALVVGASAGVGRALSEALAANRKRLLLAASDAEDLNALARHLRLVYGATVVTVAADARDPDAFAERISAAAAEIDDIDELYFPIGFSRRDDGAQLDADASLAILNSNLTVVTAVTARFLPGLLRRPKARIVGFGSIAAVRGRKANVIYSAAKRGLESYFESLRHLTAGAGVIVQLYRLGYIETQQSFGQRLLFPVVTPEQVARYVSATEGRDFGACFFPRFWWLIALAVAWLPWRIYKKLDF
ncbi:SDR family NAD(P)-dependent oxidoreductase [Bradyrhizobium sp. Leo170]|uniref:SDR family NAD(P)-dependent oxidoreductase n=1 Tax=Bradyrhizobium sp. Leo170 TaxID=1571199 RepID=UPI00102ED326|nr:SDR family NAD(P)-dependent oxidoreductase [Bradyrhizobium sp. Leo170]TAI65241.1 short-chain dehydrogenase [Bradyrhizobium sp. Leo170]